MNPILRPVLAALALVLLAAAPARADSYVIDTKGAHAFIQFKIKHLGYSWLLGRFNTFEGSFEVDEKAPEKASIRVSIDPASVDSNHAERDKHLRGPDFLDVGKYPTAGFVSTRVEPTGAGTAVVHGDFTLRGVTRPLAIQVRHIGGGKDPWGGFRRGFEGTTRFALADFGIPFDLGPAAREVEIFLSIEGIRK